MTDISDNASGDLPKAAQKVADAAKQIGFEINVQIMPASTRTAQDAATACNCTTGQIVKSLIFEGAQSGAPYLLLVSGPNRANQNGLAAILGEKLKRMDINKVREITGFAIGGIPPLGHATKLVPYMDEDLMQFDLIWAAAGTPQAVFATTPQDLAAATGAQVIEVT